MLYCDMVHPLYGTAVCCTVLHCSRVSEMCGTKCDYMTNFVYTILSGRVRSARDEYHY
jgi:hypothetical protein